MTDTIKNKEIMKKIAKILKELDASDSALKQIVLNLLQETLFEQSTGRNVDVKTKLYNWIDAEITFRHKK